MPDNKNPIVTIEMEKVHLPLGVPPGGGLPFVVELFALGQTNLQLDPGAAEVDGQGNQRVAILFDAPKEPHDLPLVHQQPAGAAGVLVKDVASPCLFPQTMI